MMGARVLTHADGSTLYSVKDGTLLFEILSNDIQDIQMTVTSGNKIDFDPLLLYGANGEENHNMVLLQYAEKYVDPR